MNKRAISPLLATSMLLVFAIILGTIVMNMGREYVEGITEIEELSIEEFDDPLKILKTRYASGEISEEEFFRMKENLS